MVKSFLFLGLGLIVSSGTGTFSAPVAETLTKSTTPHLDQTAQTSADGKRTIRAAVPDNEASSENRAFVDPVARLKGSSNWLNTTLKKWTGVEFVTEKVQNSALKRKLNELFLIHGKKLFDLIERIRKPFRQFKFDRNVKKAERLINKDKKFKAFVDEGITPNAYLVAQETLMKNPKLDAATRKKKVKQIEKYLALHDLLNSS
uniref:RxLR effector protein n=1 Tax=Peronospora matthiolae TaxID=2874970 RepID=A0AAV1TW45_9STRA